MTEEPQKERKKFRIFGRVQGVGFRYTAMYMAQDLDLTGWVRNEDDGSVTMEVQGAEEDIYLLLQKIGSSRFIEIDDVRITDRPLEEETRFRVR